jgi:hypothetical protein
MVQEVLELIVLKEIHKKQLIGGKDGYPDRISIIERG